MESLNKCRVNSGFTLVELSIVMIIIGLLIGGIFGGMKLVENANIASVVRDLKSYQAATYTFKDIYRALPGDIRNPSVRIPNCAAAPCSTGGDGNRQIGADTVHPPIATSGITDERFLFWQHLLAANLISSVKPVADVEFGEGQPELATDDGIRIVWGPLPGGATTEPMRHYFTTTTTNAAHPNSIDNLSGLVAQSIDVKLDDGMPNLGKVFAGWQCITPQNASAASTYVVSNTGCSVVYRLGF